jgi:hypothetical protein
MVLRYGTVTAQVAVKLPSTVLTVIVAEPELTPLTVPLVFTVAIAPLLVDQITFLFDALLGVTVANNARVAPFETVAVLKFKLTPVTLVTT